MSPAPGSWKLGELLVQKGWLTWEQLEEALKLQQKSAKKPGEVLLERGFITKKEIQTLHLGEILVKNGWLSWEHLGKALEMQRQTGKILGAILLENKFVSQKNLYQALADQFGRVYVDFSTIKIPAEATQWIPKHFAEEHQIMPLLKKDRMLLIAISNPHDVTPEMELKKIVTDCEIKTAIALPEDIQKAIVRHYGA